ncbi:N-succinylarginine dihydrolase [Terricaulis silvestris]|uniref:N-succinylarginine dihydrolase n=1 Tax=Terricaulis silvestris TaxID=2686094 RepID=A0A6I6MN84_9CAUL|nr:N-succinylarginine dihydrolase [Terricaulis silvestris]QGZ95531.1 N-succinylarginine dihydrolase [Terricaulis silvestris]
MSGAEEINFDGLVGPTHNYAGLSEGNLASARNANMTARPREAALQGIAKMRRLRALGLQQGVLPPHERPNITWLRSLGLTGTDGEIWAKAWKTEPTIARAALAASAMWAANAATISPSADCADGRLHATVANLQTMLHRILEAEQTERTLRRLMPDDARFAIHPALLPHDALSDEGAANHMRMAKDAGSPGVEIFVHGRKASETKAGFPARQTLEACQAIARLHGLDTANAVHARQAPEAIDAGAFHNDVVAVAHEQVLFHHENAFADKAALYAEIRAKAKGFEPVFVEVPRARVGLDDAVTSYLFNSQLVRLPGASSLTLIAPSEVRENNRTASYVAEMITQPNAAIGNVEYVEVRESMRNGGGPACLRLRIVMTPNERAAAAQGFFLTDALADNLEAWVRKHYREELAPDDLGDPTLVAETQSALDELSRILPLGADFYQFQRG